MAKLPPGGRGVCGDASSHRSDTVTGREHFDSDNIMMDLATSPFLAPSEAIDALIESSPHLEKLSDSITSTSTPSSVNPQAGWKQGGLHNSKTLEVSENSASEEDDEDDKDEDSSLSGEASQDIRVSYR
jgi:hypothetical protein